MYSLLVADDHPLFRGALKTVIDDGLADSELSEAESLAQAMAFVEANPPLDLLLLDLSLPDAQGVEGLRRLREAFPMLPVAIVSAHQERQLVLDAIALGAVGYIPKSTPHEALLAALTHILEGQLYLPAEIMRSPGARSAVSGTPTASSPASGSPPPGLAARPARKQPHATNGRFERLTDKQLCVLHCMARGMSNKHIARELMIAETTVKTHVSAILRKLGVASRVQAIVMAGNHRLSDYLEARKPT